MYNKIGLQSVGGSLLVLWRLFAFWSVHFHCIYMYVCMCSGVWHVSVCVQLLPAARGQPDRCQNDPHSAALPAQ